MTNRTLIFAALLFLGYGAITLKKGIAARKLGDLALGTLYLLGGIAAVWMMIRSGNR